MKKPRPQLADLPTFMRQVREAAEQHGNPEVTEEGCDVVVTFPATKGLNVKGRITLESQARAYSVATRIRALFPMNETHKGENRATR